jgi:hypothetical protein
VSSTSTTSVTAGSVYCAPLDGISTVNMPSLSWLRF